MSTVRNEHCKRNAKRINYRYIAYMYIRSKLIQGLSAEGLCTGSKVDNGDKIYYFADLIKILNMAESDSDHKTFTAMNYEQTSETLRLIKEKIMSIDRCKRDSSEDYRRIMEDLFPVGLFLNDNI